MKRTESKTENNLSRAAVTEHLPVIQRLYADLEIELAKGVIDKQNKLFVDYLKDELGDSKLLHAMWICSAWLNGSPFSVENYRFLKSSHDVKWSDMLVILFSKMAEHENQAPVICLALLPDGTFVREICNVRLPHKFGDDGFQSDILDFLMQQKVFIKAEIVRSYLHSKSAESTVKMINRINQVLESKLQLPPSHPLIEHQPKKGYRINPIYNIVKSK